MDLKNLKVNNNVNFKQTKFKPHPRVYIEYPPINGTK